MLGKLHKGKTLVELFGDLLFSGEVGGKQLAVPAKTFNAGGEGFDYNKTVADKYQITIPEETDFENIYASDLFKEYCLTTYKWRQEGILTGDITDTATAQDYFGGEKLFVGGGSSIDEANKSAIGAKYDFEVGCSQMVAPKITTARVTEYMWGIASNSERPDKAMDFLNYMYEDPRVANILKYGLEGVNYEFAEGSDKVIISNGSYLEQFMVCGNESECLVQAPAGEDYVEKCEAMEAEAIVSPILGYMFDDTQFQTESAVISSTIMEYLPRLQNGLAESEEATLALIDEFNAKLEACGINDVIAANQAQLDEFMANK